MKKFLLLILLFISSIGVSQDFSDGMVVVEFNASFNASNKVPPLLTCILPGFSTLPPISTLINLGLINTIHDNITTKLD